MVEYYWLNWLNITVVIMFMLSYTDCSFLWIYSAHGVPLFPKRFRCWPTKIVSKYRQQQCKPHTDFKIFRINVLSSNSREITKMRALIPPKHLHKSATLLSVKAEEVILQAKRCEETYWHNRQDVLWLRNLHSECHFNSREIPHSGLKVFICCIAAGYAPLILILIIIIIIIIIITIIIIDNHTPCVLRHTGYRASRIPYLTNLLRKTPSKSWRSNLHSYSL
jgi:hypothetical protein